MSCYTFSLAHAKDDAQLRERMASDWIEGATAISLRREPSYFSASRLQGDKVQVIIGRDTVTGRVVATAARSITTVVLNGSPQRAALLSDIRVDRAHRGRGLAMQLLRALRTLDSTDPLPTHALVYDDNEVALRSLTAKRAGMPQWKQFGGLTVLALRLGKRRPELELDGVELRRAHANELPAVVHFLNAHRKGNWAPLLDVADFEPGGRCDTLQARDFFVAVKGGNPCAVIAAWDQSSLRQAHVERYSRPLAWMRPAYNAYAWVRGRARLPAHGQALPYLYLAFIAVEHHDTSICAALLRYTHNRLAEGPWLYALAALNNDDPLLPVFSAYPAAHSAVRLYEVDFETRADTTDAPSPDSRSCVEFALT
ncbi:GNAT family N-acetyltransferase [Ralstonia chuxiongensis]|uniref:GNAT family N-acetyltransferase n=1 Tax=Ralstonia chuxiongensis TaxID=2957504 RepID=A0AA42BJY8_9RALS|nr:GNAT family N-acetyltransferase [Ralstonia chuxiongensis]MCP1175695.1 GNAT family N-acetyltransferase [Ralstonia chuxiongensis]